MDWGPPPAIEPDDPDWLRHPARDQMLLPIFRRYLRTLNPCRVLELGTRRWKPDAPSIHRHFAPDWAEFIGTDFMDGEDVDVVADAHELSTAFDRPFDGIMAISVFEHLARPWIAAREVAALLKPGGMLMVHVPFAFPEHGYPDDYWRFTKSGLRILFEDAGLTTLATDYEAPARIQCEADPDIAGIEAFASARILSQKPL